MYWLVGVRTSELRRVEKVFKSALLLLPKPSKLLVQSSMSTGLKHSLLTHHRIIEVVSTVPGTP